MYKPNIKLMAACQNNDIDQVMEYAPYADISYKTTALKIAAYDGYVDIVRVLLKYGADPSSQNLYALRQAKIRHHYDVIVELSKYT